MPLCLSIASSASTLACKVATIFASIRMLMPSAMTAPSVPGLIKRFEPSASTIGAVLAEFSTAQMRSADAAASSRLLPDPQVDVGRQVVSQEPAAGVT